MAILEFLLLLLIAAVCGGLSMTLAGSSRGGCLLSIAMGFIGALLGSWLQRLSGLPEIFTVSVGGGEFPIIWSIIGGALFAALIGLLTRRRSALS